MAAESVERESPLEATDRRIRFLHTAIDELVRQKRGNQGSHGETTLILHWKAGVCELVTVQDGSTYK